MSSKLTPGRTLAAMLAALLAGLALASTAPFKFAAFGSFKHMSHTGDTAGKVKLSQLPNAPGTWGVGALAGLKGEILVADGKVLVSRGNDSQGRLEAPKADDEAVLFASATVSGWAELAIPRDMNQAALEAFVLDQAKARGIDTEQAFAFLVDGTYPMLRWHVVTGDKPGGHSGGGHGSQTGGHGGGHGTGHANQQAGMRDFQQPGQSGRLVGIYSGKALEGVVSHPGERFHLHYVDRSQQVSGHVDAYAVQAGAVLRLPVGR